MTLATIDNGRGSITLVNMTKAREPSEFGKRLKALREARGLSQNQLSIRSDPTDPVDASYISQLESGERKGKVGIDIAVKLAKGLTMPDRSCSVNELYGLANTTYEGKWNNDTVSTANHGYVAAGKPQEAYEVDLGTTPVPIEVIQQHPKAFTLTVSGDSLEDDGIHDGDIVVVDPVAVLQVGKLYIVRIGPEFCARHVYIEGDVVRLKAANSHYEDIKVTDCNIVGRVIYKMGKM